MEETLTKKINDCLRFYDVAGLLASGAPEDEYESEAEIIENWLDNATDEIELQHFLHSFLNHRFGINVGDFKSFEPIAADLWKIKGPHRTYKTKYSAA